MPVDNGDSFYTEELQDAIQQIKAENARLLAALRTAQQERDEANAGYARLGAKLMRFASENADLQAQLTAALAAKDEAERQRYEWRNSRHSYEAQLFAHLSSVLNHPDDATVTDMIDILGARLLAAEAARVEAERQLKALVAVPRQVMLDYLLLVSNLVGRYLARVNDSDSREFAGAVSTKHDEMVKRLSKRSDPTPTQETTT